MRLAAIAALLLTACGGTRQPLQSPPAPAAPVPVEPDDDAAAAPATPVGSAAAPVAAAPKPPADTPMCRQFKAAVAAAEARFAPMATPTSTPLPGASTCTVVGGDGPGQTSLTTYTCEYESADDAAVLAAKRDALEERLRECGSSRALEHTRVRIARAGSTSVLVINIHDTARW
ncbi:MAG TPA: hypothetical protein VML75_21485 [Kofleriaceae bacterium]|nr:hypothetical protein [Kofleriaceae bacterium]